MTIQNRAVRPVRLAARVAPYQEAVDAGRRAGLTWGDLGQIFGVSARAMAAACKRARRYQVAQLAQLPLPDPAPKPTQEPVAVLRPPLTAAKPEATAHTTRTPSPAGAGGGFKNLNRGT